MIDRALAQVDINADELPGANIDLEGLLAGGINIFLAVIAVTAFASLIYSGFLYITAGGDAAVATKARKNILWALIAIVIALLSYVIIRAAADIPGFSEELNNQEETSEQTESTNNENDFKGPVDVVAP